jgi:hypothetical protein
MPLRCRDADHLWPGTQPDHPLHYRKHGPSIRGDAEEPKEDLLDRVGDVGTGWGSRLERKRQVAYRAPDRKPRRASGPLGM